MKLKSLIATIFLLCPLLSAAATRYDVCVYGGTSSGVIAAYSAAKMGARVVLVGPDVTLGGMTTGGLGLTDIGNKQAVTGISRQFYRRLGNYYGTLEKWVFEPHVAEAILESYLSEVDVKVVRNAPLMKVEKDGSRIVSIKCGGRTFSAKQFIDCSYEGDLMAMAGVSYATGREDNSEYGETYNGSQLMDRHQFPDGIDPFVEEGKPESGLLWGISDKRLKADGTGDGYIQAYNYRVCLTNVPENRIAIRKPHNYDPSHYALLPRLFAHSPENLELKNWFIWSLMPNGKTDINNYGAFSTDMIGESHSYPEASWKERKKIIKAHKDYTLGLLYYYAHDEQVPAALRAKVAEWGLPKDEYRRTNHWTHQLYIREARRLVGEYVATQADCEGRTEVTDGIAYAAYNMDSHNCERIVVEKDGRYMVKNEGNVEIPGGRTYPIPYRAIVPKRDECTNLCIPVCLSASHIAYGSIRMEPVFMATGQIAGMAAAMAGEGVIQTVNVPEIQSIMKNNPYLDGTDPDILLDDNTEYVRYSGWRSVKAGGGYGNSYLKLTAPDPQAYVTYTVPSGIDGKYSVYAYHLKDDRLNAITDYEITIGGKTSSFRFDRDKFEVIGQTKGEWVCLGSFDFNGDGGEIRVIPVHDGKPAQTDAILLVK